MVVPAHTPRAVQVPVGTLRGRVWGTTAILFQIHLKIIFAQTPALSPSPKEQTEQAVGRGCSTPAQEGFFSPEPFPLGQPSRSCCPLCHKQVLLSPVPHVSPQSPGQQGPFVVSQTLGHKQPQLRCHTKPRLSQPQDNALALHPALAPEEGRQITALCSFIESLLQQEFSRPDSQRFLFEV